MSSKNATRALRPAGCSRGRPGFLGRGSQSQAPGTEPASQGVGTDSGGHRKPPRISPLGPLRPELSARPGRDLAKRPPEPGPPRLPAAGPRRFSASPSPARVPTGPHRRFSRGLLWAAPPAPHPFPPAGPTHPKDEVEKHQYGLGGGDAALAHGAGGRLRPCSASGMRSPSEAAMATAPPG